MYYIFCCEIPDVHSKPDDIQRQVEHNLKNHYLLDSEVKINYIFLPEPIYTCSAYFR